MKKYILIFSLFFFHIVLAQEAADIETSIPVYPGEPGKQPFWNTYAKRFIYAPAFDFPEIKGALSYRFTITGDDNKQEQFVANKPWKPLSPVWDKISEGYTALVVEGLDGKKKTIGIAGKRSFYKSPGFSGKYSEPEVSYQASGLKGLKALFDAPNVQYWLTHAVPDPAYNLYCYPNKVMGGVIRAMAAYSKVVPKKQDQAASLKIAKSAADYLLSVRYSNGWRYANVPPTYLANVDKPTPEAMKGAEKQWLMVPSTVDAAFGFLDLYDITQDKKYLDAGNEIAKVLARTQENDGTWPLMVNAETGEPVHAQRLIPTWVIFFFDRFAHQYKITEYKTARKRAWEWIVNNPLKTFQWNGQFEDIHPQAPYMNLAREQACDVAVLLLDEIENPEKIAQAEELLRFAEDQFVFWQPVKSPEGLRKAIGNSKRLPEEWFTPSVIEQYRVYEPVARSCAIMINAYLKAHQATKKSQYLNKAKAIANTLVNAQSWVEKTYGGTGEIPTWVWKKKPSNWLNNSYYAAQAVLNMANAAPAK
ncbi:MAG: hypothetical protein WKF68_12465 [Daejeonella sp.]